MLRFRLYYYRAVVRGRCDANGRRYPRIADTAGRWSGLVLFGVRYWSLLYLPLAGYLFLSSTVRTFRWQEGRHLDSLIETAVLTLTLATAFQGYRLVGQAKPLMAGFEQRPRELLAVVSVVSVAAIPPAQQIYALGTAAAADATVSGAPLMFVIAWIAAIGAVARSFVKQCIDLRQPAVDAAWARR